jgi:hypothetical protein
MRRPGLHSHRCVRATIVCKRSVCSTSPLLSPLTPPHPSRCSTPPCSTAVESWQPPVNHSTRTIHVYSNAPEVQVALNGAAVGNTLLMPYQVRNNGSRTRVQR